MRFLKQLKHSLLAARRLGAFKRARQQGMAAEQAREYSENVYPPTADDIAYEETLRRREGLPWPSVLSLLYPIAATLYIASTAAPLADVVGYGLANLGYLLFAAGIAAGHFLIFHLQKRWQVFIAAAVSLGVGMLLSNVNFS